MLDFAQIELPAVGDCFGLFGRRDRYTVGVLLSCGIVVCCVRMDLIFFQYFVLLSESESVYCSHLEFLCFCMRNLISLLSFCCDLSAGSLVFCQVLRVRFLSLILALTSGVSLVLKCNLFLCGSFVKRVYHRGGKILMAMSTFFVDVEKFKLVF
ncbi:hypothetical protein CEXT_789161 [Caerostris extrusa]|uniref:Transmembrane protein n=1 Tax=Caerostris extrusa TaxID=172846 RepID=A0AAV4TYM4_CAEEX|nr:hypothetical protein CEXT_789161 [Caerostris extrusa]